MSPWHPLTSVIEPHRAGTDGSANIARLLVDGEQVDGQSEWRIDDAKLTHDGLVVGVTWWWTGRVLRCELVEQRDVDEDKSDKTSFEPPAGTRAHRPWTMQQERPGLYASRHVAIEAGQVLVLVLGIGALLSALLATLLPRIDLSWIPFPDIAISMPSW
ncbi:MAG: hypothetical protein GEU96_18190 [Propionibacteriales bacterium]|nr:hypothetical protein [Propionibacteriales bacterium]